MKPTTKRTRSASAGRLRRRAAACALAAVLPGTHAIAAPELPPVSFSGVGWVQYGQVRHSSDTARNNYNGNSTQNSGAQISVSAAINERLTGAVGMGVFEGHALAGPLTAGGRVPLSVNPYIAEARFTWRLGEPGSPRLQVTGGLFPYNYNPNIKDLGLYLLRGPVYPGILISGFETKEVLPISNILGLWLRNVTGPLTSDLLVVSETDVKPYYDISLAYIGKVKAAEWLSVGAGINLYRFIPSDRKVSHEPFNPSLETPEGQVANPFQRQTIYVDTTGNRRDTTFFGFNGTKLMANLEFDPKPLLSLGDALGPQDLKVYAEAAVLGLAFDKAHEAIFGPLAERIPVTVGFNFPAFRLLDHLSLELEYYGAKFRDDMYRLAPDQDRPLSPIPFTPTNEVVVYRRDDVKWALHAARTIQGHFKVSAQVANDHFRPGGTVKVPSYEVALSTPKDWYWMAKVAYFF